MTDDKTRQLENRIETLENTIEKMMPSRRDALKMGGAALVGGAAMSGTASAGTNQVGTIGSQASPVDLESEDINNADTITTQDIVVNGTATGPFGGGGIQLSSGDTITVANVELNGTDEAFVNLYNGTSKDVLGGTIHGSLGATDFLYEFADNQTITKNGGVGATSYTRDNFSGGEDDSGDFIDVGILPPAKNVIRIEVGMSTLGTDNFGAEVLLLD